MRNIIIIALDGIDPSDYPDFVDAYISEAFNKDTQEYLTDQELDTLNEDFDLIYAAVLDHLF